jgi:hypothetical protein
MSGALDTIVPIILIVVVIGFFYIKIYLPRIAPLVQKWRDNRKEKKEAKQEYVTYE